MDNEDWANLAVQELEELDCERDALREARACAVDGDSEKRISEIDSIVDGLYARLNREAEEIALQADVVGPPPPPSPTACPPPSSTACPPPSSTACPPPSSTAYPPPSSTAYPPPASTAYPPPSSTACPPPASTAYPPPSSTAYPPEGGGGAPPNTPEPMSKNAEQAKEEAQREEAQLMADLSIFTPRSVDTVVVEHPANPNAGSKSDNAGKSGVGAQEGSGDASSAKLGVSKGQGQGSIEAPGEGGSEGDEQSEAQGQSWLEDERLELRAELERLRKTKAAQSEAFDSSSKELEGKTEALDRVNSQALAAKAALARFEQARTSIEAQLAAAKEELENQRNKEREAQRALAAMETRVRAESKLLGNLDLVRTRIESTEAALSAANRTAEREKAELAKSVEAALVAAERATRQAEEMRDAAERAHQRAQQAIGHAQEIETRSDVREQELDRIIDGLEGQIVGLTHEQEGIEQELQELRGARPKDELVQEQDQAQGPGLTLIVDEQDESPADLPLQS